MRTELALEATSPTPLRDSWAFRSAVLAFAGRDGRVKYEQAVLGVAWEIIQPLALWILTILSGRRGGDRGGRGVVRGVRTIGGVVRLEHIVE